MIVNWYMHICVSSYNADRKDNKWKQQIYEQLFRIGIASTIYFDKITNYESYVYYNWT